MDFHINMSRTISIGRIFTHHNARRVIFPYFSWVPLSAPKTFEQCPKITWPAWLAYKFSVINAQGYSALSWRYHPSRRMLNRVGSQPACAAQEPGRLRRALGHGERGQHARNQWSRTLESNVIGQCIVMQMCVRINRRDVSYISVYFIFECYLLDDKLYHGRVYIRELQYLPIA